MREKRRKEIEEVEGNDTARLANLGSQRMNSVFHSQERVNEMGKRREKVRKIKVRELEHERVRREWREKGERKERKEVRQREEGEENTQAIFIPKRRIVNNGLGNVLLEWKPL
jgi:hypothetical protein